MKSALSGNFLSMMPCTLTFNAKDIEPASRARSSPNQHCGFPAFVRRQMGVVLGIYLYRIGLTSLFIAFVVAAGLAGSALATILMSLAADRIGRKHFLVVLSLTSAVGGIALVTMPSLLMLAIMAFVGMLNGTGTDRSAAYVLDQAVIPGLAGDARRTWNLALYNLFLDGGGSLGALAAGLPLLLQPRRALSLLSSYRVVFLCVLRTVPNSRSALFASLSGGRDRERVNAHPLQR